jgi:uncharacterized membrane protein
MDKETAMTDCNAFHYPTPEEMTALTAAAHRNRARWMKLMLLRGIRAVKLAVARLTAVPAAKRMSHA